MSLIIYLRKVGKSGITRRIHFNDVKEILATESDCHNLNEYHYKLIETSCLLFLLVKAEKHLVDKTPCMLVL